MAKKKTSSSIVLNKASVLTHLTTNISSKFTRNASLEGREYIVCPMVMGVEGVLPGSDGPGFYPGDEWEKYAPSWNHKPIVVYHPEIEGKGVSACEPAILNARKIGLVLNTRYDRRSKKLRAEAWIDKEKVGSVDNRVAQAIVENMMMEVSTGLYVDKEMTPGKDPKGRAYDWIARNHRPDHLAILPDEIGACSIADGAGLLQLNSSMSVEDVRKALAQACSLLVNKGYLAIRDNIQRLLEKSVAVDAFVTEVYDGVCVYWFSGDYYSVEYQVVDELVSFTSSPEKVTQVVTYTKMSGSIIGNSSTETKKMAKKELVDALIAKGGPWQESDRTYLEGLDDARISAFESVKAPEVKTPEVKTPEVKTPETKAPETKVETPTPAPAPAPQPASFEQVLAAAPPEYREMIEAGLATHNAQRAQLIATITANKNNKFTAEALGKMKTPDLAAIAELAANSTPAPTHNANAYYGGVMPFVQTPSGAKEEPLLIPTLNFEKK